MKMRILGTIIFFLFFSTRVFAESKVLINEFTIEPNQVVELLNTDSQNADISSWYLDDAGGATFFTVPQNTVIPPNSCLLFQSDFNLNKSTSDTVRLFDSSATPTSSSARLIDSFVYSKSPGLNMSFFRQPDGAASWASGEATLGKFNATGSACIPVSPTETPPTPNNTPSPTQQPSPAPRTDYNKIYISEVMVAPKSGDGEWVELYNGNDFEVVLTNWYLDDRENEGSPPRVFTTMIPPFSYVAVELTAQIFNDSGDTVRILNFNKVEKDSFEYKSSSKGTTLGRSDFSLDTFCEQSPTKNAKNAPCSTTTIPIASSTPIIYSAPSPSPEVIDYQSSISQKIPKQIIQNNSTPGEVMGSKSSIVQSLSLAALGYSLLTIAAVIIRMRKEVLSLWEKFSNS